MQDEAKPTIRVLLVDDAGAFVRLEDWIPDVSVDDGSLVVVPDGADTVKAALIDADGLFVRVDELAPALLTPRHLPRITACDLDPVRGYRWVPTPKDKANPQRGRFDPLPRKTAEVKFDDAEPLPALACFFLRAWLRDETALPPQTLAWTDQYVRSHDFKTVLEKSPEAQKYYLRRGLKA